MAWDKLYGTQRWRKRSRFNLRQHPMCVECAKAGRTRVANLSHHVDEFRPGDGELKFYLGALTSVCYECHARVHGRPARLPYDRTIAPDGFPADELNHPFWRASRQVEERERKWQKDLPRKKAKP